MTPRVVAPDERIAFSTEYADSANYNSSGRTERYTLDVPASILTDFNKLWYYLGNQTLIKNTWLGVPLIKYPTDLFIYQEILFSMKPDLVIECGAYKGGSALFMATIMDAIGKGVVYSVDILEMARPAHDRIHYLIGSSTAPEIVDQIKPVVTSNTLVILDSDHRAAHVADELRVYAPMATYLIVEDTNINGHPIRPDFGPGPFEAVQDFLKSPDGVGWEMDRQRERLLLTVSPGGFLRRKK